MSDEDRREIEELRDRNDLLYSEVARLSLQVSELANALQKYIKCARNCPCPETRSK